jgi:hypothetical protein
VAVKTWLSHCGLGNGSVWVAVAPFDRGDQRGSNGTGLNVAAAVPADQRCHASATATLRPHPVSDPVAVARRNRYHSTQRLSAVRTVPLRAPHTPRIARHTRPSTARACATLPLPPHIDPLPPLFLTKIAP